MINLTKELPQNTSENMLSSIQKFPMTAPSRQSMISAVDNNNGQKWITMDNNGQKWTTINNNGQQWTTMDNNGQQ